MTLATLINIKYEYRSILEFYAKVIYLSETSVTIIVSLVIGNVRGLSKGFFSIIKHTCTIIISFSYFIFINEIL